MSHCLVVKQNDNIFIGADTALSTKINNQHYRLEGNAVKLFQFNNIIIFCSGKLSIVSPIIESLKEFKNIGLDVIQDVAKREYDLRNGNEDIDIIAVVQDKSPKVYSISPYNEFQISELRGVDQGINVWSAGIRTEQGIDLCEQEIIRGNTNIISIYRNVFDSLSSEVVGGELHLYHVNNENIAPAYKGIIAENNVKRINVPVYTNAHLVVAERLIGKVILGEQLIIGDEEGTFEIVGNLLTIKDRNEVVRLRLGEYASNRFGLQLMNKSGSQVVLDENGLLQSWQDGRSDNVDASHALTLYVYIPDSTLEIRDARLNFRLLPFRSYSGTTESGGGSVQTSSSGGSVQTTTASGGGTSTTSGSGGGVSTSTSAGGSTTQTSGQSDGWEVSILGLLTDNAIPNGNSHRHGFSINMADLDHWHNVSVPSHTHGFSVPNHTHSVSLSPHTHQITIDSHQHSVQIPTHKHDIAHAIYTSTIATGVGVIINGINRTAQLGGKFNSSQANLNISNYLQTGRWNEIELTSDRLGRIDASVFVQVFLST